MEPTKVCSRCGGQVNVDVVREKKPNGTFTSYAVGTCQSCGATFTEAEVMKLPGPGPVGG
jgi:rRNA maturation endonuclease Nob1